MNLSVNPGRILDPNKPFFLTAYETTFNLLLLLTETQTIDFEIYHWSWPAKWKLMDQFRLSPEP